MKKPELNLEMSQLVNLALTQVCGSKPKRNGRGT